MKYRVVHELPGRLRIHLDLPQRTPVDRTQVEVHLHDLAGVSKVSFTPRTGSLLVHHDGRPATRAALLERLAAAPVPGRLRPRPATELERKKRTVVRSGTLLLLRPLIPPPVRPLLAVAGALPIIRKGAAAAAARKLNVDVLDASAVGAALATRDFFTASIITFLLKLGDYLEEWTRKRSHTLLTGLFHAEEEWVWVVRRGKEVRVALEKVQPGETVVVRMGSFIPVDGTVLEGEALVNQASLTGESLAVAKSRGKPVYAGTVVEEGSLRVQAVKVGGETRAAQVIKIIEEGAALKAQVQSQSEALADRIVPYSFLLSGLTYLGTGNPARAAAVLLVDYSCAIKLSTPVAILASLAHGARHRVLIKGGKYLEKLAEADAFVLDKTGTLTEAAPQVAAVVAFNGFEPDFILSQAACVEEHFPHPVATAVVRQAAALGLHHPEEHAEVEYVLAHGIVSRLHDRRILVGSRHFVHEDEGVAVEKAEAQIEDFARQGYSVLYVAFGRELAGLIAIHDPLRPEARPFIEALRQSGIEKIVMLTGDNEASARTIAAELGIGEYYAQAFPERKVEVIRQLKAEGYTVAMVGDGINDSPALAQADVGISMKHGADIAREACDVLLMDGTLEDILVARKIAREGMTLIRENFHQILVINSAAMLMAVTGAAPPVFSAAMHNLATIGAGLRALKPLRHHD
jgi:heavy metal translocating P-type ATPase